MAACVLFSVPAAYGDDFNSRINLELAFRDKILDKPAPPCYQSLIRDGEVTITFTRDLPGTVGKTEFLLNLDWSYDYRYTTQSSDGVTEVTVTPLNIKLTPRLRHVIRMPVAFYRADVWDSRLLGHEFDHIAVSLDPRPRAMLVHLCSNLPAHRFSISDPEKPSDKQMREGINREIQRRQAAVLDLLRTNYVALDKATKHGRTSLQDRSGLFDSFYTRAHLEAVEFPFLQELDSLLDSDSYQRLRARNVVADPTARPRQ